MASLEAAELAQAVEVAGVVEPVELLEVGAGEAAADPVDPEVTTNPLY